MAKWTVGKGMDDWLANLERLNKDADEYLGDGIYDGAAIVADEIRKKIQSLPEIPERGSKGRINGVTPLQKQGLLDGLGIAKMRDDNGFIHVKIGMDGYNKKQTKSHPKGQPNAMIARATCTGTSFSVKNDFIGRAIRSTQKKAEEKMRQTIEAKIEAISKN